MKCSICGSKKNVREFSSAFGRPSYTECRKCFEKVYKFGCKTSGLKFSKSEVEAEWNRGKSN